MKQVKWFERIFDFNTEENNFPSIIERLAGTPLRLEEKCRTIPGDLLAISINNTWTIKQNIGHLADLEPLWQGRIEDIVNDSPELRPADLQNKKTEEANHNETPIDDLLETFRRLRSQTLTMLEKTDETAFSK